VELASYGVEVGRDGEANVHRSRHDPFASPSGLAITTTYPSGSRSHIFAMLRGRIDVRLLNERRLEGPHALHCGVEVVHLKPQKNAVPNWRRVGVDEVRVLLFMRCV